MEILEGIAIQHDQVSDLACLDGAELVINAHRTGALDRFRAV